MIDLLPDAPDPANDIPTVFNQKAAALVLALNPLVRQWNASIASANSMAAGGAYAIPFSTLLGANNVGSAGGGYMGLMGANDAPTPSDLSLVARLYVDTRDARGADVTTLLDSLIAGSTSAAKGNFRICRAGDPSAWLTFMITSVTSGATNGNTWRWYGVSCTGFSSKAPFLPADSLLLFFQRTGDKGDIGGPPYAIIRDQRANGVAPAAGLAAAAWTTRVLNSLNINTISGLTLGTSGANTFTVPPGTYLIDASAPSGGGGAHQIRLFNVTGQVVYDVGSNEASNTTALPTRSTLRTAFTVTSATVFRIDHFATTANAGGNAVSSGSAEIYTEIRILKVG